MLQSLFLQLCLPSVSTSVNSDAVEGKSLTYFLVYVPECKGRSLEEIDLLFEDKISALQSRHWYPQHVSAQLRAMAHEDMTGEANKKNQPEHVAGEANA